jgi:arsenite-transporting ATPase
VINQALAPLTLSDPLLLQKQAHEDRYVREVVESHADRAVMVSWQKEPPIGAEKLHALMMSDVSA